MRRSAIFTALFCALGAIPASASTISFAGSTLGCFTAGCTPVAGTPTSGNLTFTTTSFTASVENDNSDFEDVVLGTFSIPSSGNVTPNNTFLLEVAFALPLGSGGTTYTANVTGTINPAPGNNSVQVVFPNTPIQINYTGGSFYVSVLNDPTLSRISTIGSTRVDLLGRIGNVTAGASTGAVPEPASLVLLGTGLLAAAAVRRRKK